ncbi:MAG: DUF5665 domain-containing protein [Bacillota bacterium]
MLDHNDLGEKVARLTQAMEAVNLAEYVELVRSPWRMAWINFVAGLARGVGIAIGFTLLAALVLYFLRQLAVLNLPLIGNFIADIVQIVQDHLARGI